MRIAVSVLVFALCVIPGANARTPDVAGLVMSPSLQAGTQSVAPNRPGPWNVGRRTVSFIDTARNERLVVIDLWYPVDAADTAGVAPSEYNLVFASIQSPLALDAPPVSAAGPFPLMLFSHGNFGIRFQSYYLTELLASHGFVVAAMDHAGNTAIDLVFDTLAPFDQVRVDRPLDVSFTIDSLLAASAEPGGHLFGRIDASRIGVAGHSFGGYTALAAAGGIDEAPADARIDAVLPISPASGLLTDAQLAAVTVPALIVGGTDDITTPVDDQSSRPFALLPSPDRLRVDLVTAGHQSFTNICVFTDALLAAGVDPFVAAFLLGNADEGCAPELMPIDEAHELSGIYVVSYAKTHVAGDPRYLRYLDSALADGKNLPVLLFLPGD